MPKERRELAGAIISDNTKWTYEEIITWLDNEEMIEKERYNRLNIVLF